MPTLICSANVASAQVVVGIENVSTTQTSAGRIIDFNFNLSRELTGSEFLNTQIAFENVSPSEGSARLLTDYTVSRSNCRFGRFQNVGIRFIVHQVCMDAGEKDVALQLELNNSFDTRKTILISVFLSGGVATITEGVEIDPNKSVFRFPGTAVFVRIKVFLEGALQ